MVLKVDLMRHNLLEAILGAIVLCFAGYFLVFAYKSGYSSSNAGYAVFAKFDRIDGVVAGNDVKISGVKVGTVQKIEVEAGSYRAKVTMSINKDVKIPSDSSAEIVSESLLGGKYIAIVPGVSGKTLTANGRISKTQSSVNLEGLLSKFIFNTEKSSDDKTKDKKSEAPESGSTSTSQTSLTDGGVAQNSIPQQQSQPSQPAAVAIPANNPSSSVVQPASTPPAVAASASVATAPIKP